MSIFTFNNIGKMSSDNLEGQAPSSSVVSSSAVSSSPVSSLVERTDSVSQISLQSQQEADVKSGRMTLFQLPDNVIEGGILPFLPLKEELSFSRVSRSAYSAVNANYLERAIRCGYEAESKETVESPISFLKKVLIGMRKLCLDNSDFERFHFLSNGKMNVDSLKNILKAKEDIVKILDSLAPDPFDFTSLMEAVYEENFPLVTFLIKIGVDVNKVNKKGHSALTIAAASGYLDIIKLLLKKNADINLQDNKGETPLMVAVKAGYLEVVEFLLDQDKILIDLQNKEGNTALMEAARCGRSEIVKLLIVKGANQSFINQSGKTYSDIVLENQGMSGPKPLSLDFF